MTGTARALPWRARPAGAPGRALLLDIDGVVVTGREVMPGAVEAVGAARAAGAAVRFVTNNASRTPAQVADHLGALGVPADPGDVVTSAVVAVALVRERVVRTGGRAGGVVAVVGGEGLFLPLADAELAAAPARDVAVGTAAALVQGFAPDVAWPDLAAAAHHARAGTWWVATNLDPTLPTERGPAPGNGSLVRAVATAAGRDPDRVAGKPDPVMVHRAVPPPAATGADTPDAPDDGDGVVLVGDRLDTDVAAALAAGVTAALVLSGVHGVEDVLRASPGTRPHLLARDLPGIGASHPAVTLLGPGTARCADVEVRVAASGPGAGTVRLEVTDGPDLDTARALCSAVWSLADDLTPGDAGRLLDAVVAHPAAARALACGRTPVVTPSGGAAG